MIKKIINFPEVDIAGNGKENDGDDELHEARLFPRTHVEMLGCVWCAGVSPMFMLPHRQTEPPVSAPLPDLGNHSDSALVCLLMLSTCLDGQVVDCCLVAGMVHIHI